MIKHPVIAAIAGAVLLAAVFIHPFLLRSLYSILCFKKPVAGARALVIEGWLFTHMWSEAADELQGGSYGFCVITCKDDCGCTGDGKRMTVTADDFRTMLKQRNCSHITVYEIPVPTDREQFTYRSAVLAKRWFRRNKPEVHVFNIFTGGHHAAKTLTIYNRIFGKDFTVGIIPASIRHFDPENWWKSKRGIRSVTRYTIGYLYALFYPFKKEE